jgi:predicted dehydrogenase
MAPTIRVGIVGARFAAHFHLDGLRRVFGVPLEVVGVTSKTASACHAFARAKGLRPIDSLEQLYAAGSVLGCRVEMAE